MSIRNGVTVRGTSNRNERGSAEDRRRRRLWLLKTYAADVRVLDDRDTVLLGGQVGLWADWDSRSGCWIVPVSKLAPGQGEAACRCYRCGRLLTFATMTVDRIIPGVLGGTYRRNNIRPACGGCNSETGGGLAGRGAGNRG